MKLKISIAFFTTTVLLPFVGCDPCLTSNFALAPYPNYEQALAVARDAAATNSICDLLSMAFHAGTCGGGDFLFIFFSGGEVVEITVYDAETGEFIGATIMLDVSDELCEGIRYVGRRIECSDRVVLESLCP